MNQIYQSSSKVHILVLDENYLRLSHLFEISPKIVFEIQDDINNFVFPSFPTVGSIVCLHRNSPSDSTELYGNKKYLVVSVKFDGIGLSNINPMEIIKMRHPSKITMIQIPDFDLYKSKIWNFFLRRLFQRVIDLTSDVKISYNYKKKHSK